MIESDLKIDDFIYDKAIVASFGNDTSVHLEWAPFSVFQEQVFFTAVYGGTATPAWKFARAAVNQTTTLATVSRDEINTLVITLGPLDLTTLPSVTSPLQLKGNAQSQHQASAIGVATSGSQKASQSP